MTKQRRDEEGGLLKPLVSVIVPAYNAQQSIGETLGSILSQTYTHFEIIVVDDGSKDKTTEIVQQCMKKDKRIRLLQQPNAGVAAARNYGIRQSKGQFIAPLDSDDIWFPFHLEKQVDQFLGTPRSIGLVYSWSVDIDEGSNLTGAMRAANIQGDVLTTLICHNFLGNASASMMRRSCIDEVGSYDTSLRDRQAQGCEDLDLYLRIAERFDFRCAPFFTVGYRKLSNSMSGDYQQMASSHALVLNSLKARNPSLPNFLFRLSRSNLYIYFAQQSTRHRWSNTTLIWIRRAILADPVSCWIHPGLFELAAKGIWILIGGRKSHVSQSKGITLRVEDINSRSIMVLRLLALGNIYHHFISLFTHDISKQRSETKLVSWGDRT